MPLSHLPPATAAHPPEHAHLYLPPHTSHLSVCCSLLSGVTNGIHEYSLANPSTQVTDSGFHTEPCRVGTITLIRTELERALSNAAGFSSSSTPLSNKALPCRHNWKSSCPSYWCLGHPTYFPALHLSSYLQRSFSGSDITLLNIHISWCLVRLDIQGLGWITWA